MLSSLTTTNSGDDSRYKFCGVHVKTGTLIIGYIQVAVLPLFGLVVIMLFSSAASGDPGRQLFHQYFTGDNDAVGDENAVVTDNFNDDVIPVIFAGLAVGLIVEALITALLLIGAHRERRVLLLPHLVVGALGVASGVLRLLAALLERSPSSLFGAILALGIELLFFWIPYRYFQYLHEKERKMRVLGAAGNVSTVNIPQTQMATTTPQPPPYSVLFQMPPDQSQPPSYDNIAMKTPIDPPPVPRRNSWHEHETYEEEYKEEIEYGRSVASSRGSSRERLNKL